MARDEGNKSSRRSFSSCFFTNTKAITNASVCSGPLEDADVVNLEGLCPGGGVVLWVEGPIPISREEVSSHGQVQDHVEALVEWLPVCSVRVRPNTAVEAALQSSRPPPVPINVPADLVCVPLEDVGVEVVCEVHAIVPGPTPLVPVVGPLPAKVQRVLADPVILPTELHDVNLSTGSPLAVPLVRRQHPDGRPQEVPTRHLGADFKPPVGPRAINGLQRSDPATRGWLGPGAGALVVVGAVLKGPLVARGEVDGLDGQDATRDTHVGGVVHIALSESRRRRRKKKKERR